jgi:hypothetical protein
MHSRYLCSCYTNHLLTHFTIQHYLEEAAKHPEFHMRKTAIDQDQKEHTCCPRCGGDLVGTMLELRCQNLCGISYYQSSHLFSLELDLPKSKVLYLTWFRGACFLQWHDKRTENGYETSNGYKAPLTIETTLPFDITLDRILALLNYS